MCLDSWSTLQIYLKLMLSIISHVQLTLGLPTQFQSCPRGAVVRAEVQRSDDPCIPGLNPTVGRECRSFG
jgi:hypothetical protein